MPSFRTTWLLTANLLALPLLCIPAYGFIRHMNLRGIPLFVGVAWLGVAVMALALWTRAARTSPFAGYLLTLAAAYVPAVTAWAIALHPLYGRDGAPIANLWPWGARRHGRRRAVHRGLLVARGVRERPRAAPTGRLNRDASGNVARQPTSSPRAAVSRAWT